MCHSWYPLCVSGDVFYETLLVSVVSVMTSVMFHVSVVGLILCQWWCLSCVTGGVCHVSLVVSVTSCQWWGSSCVTGGFCHVSVVVHVMC